jgi:hypothetical protein
VIKAKKIDDELWIKASDHQQAIKEVLVQTQEPAATLAVREHAPVGKVAYVLEVNLPVGIHKLYTNPRQRTWVRLTDREMMDAIYIDDTPMEMGRKIEAKLKEKNI